MRIASLIPSATEIAFALGLGDAVVGVSHECDYPPAVVGRPVLTRTAINMQDMRPAEIDRAVAALLHDGGSTYTIDAPLLRRLAPDLILTQALCDVCAVSESQVHRAAHEEELGARVLTLSPLTLEGIFESIEQVGDAAGRGKAAREVTAALRARVARARATAPQPLRRVLALEWLDPPFTAGHWVPEQIEAAGGIDVIGRAGEKSARTSWDAIAETQPHVVILLPCGFSQPQVVQQARQLETNPSWQQLPAVREGAVWAVDAGAWFSRPGPRAFDGIDVLARIFADPLADTASAGTARLHPSSAA